MLGKTWYIGNGTTRLFGRFALTACYLLAVLGGSLHYVLDHGVSHAEASTVVDGSPGLESGCDDTHHDATTAECRTCISLARTFLASPATAICAVLPEPHIVHRPSAFPALSMPFRPQAQRGPPVQV